MKHTICKSITLFFKKLIMGFIKDKIKYAEKTILDGDEYGIFTQPATELEPEETITIPIDAISGRMNLYSLDETLIGYDKISDKPIYRKALEFPQTDIAISDVFNIIHNINILEYFRVDVIGDSYGGANLKVAFKVGTTGLTDITSFQPNDIDVFENEKGSVYSVGAFLLILEYTKN